MIRDPQLFALWMMEIAREKMPQGREQPMLTTQQIREHFESLEMDRLRAEVKELQTRLNRLQSELLQCRRESSLAANSTTAPPQE